MCVLVSYETETDTVLCRIYASGIWGNGCQHPDGVEELCVLKISVLKPEKASIYLELHLTSPHHKQTLLFMFVLTLSSYYVTLLALFQISSRTLHNSLETFCTVWCSRRYASLKDG